MVGLALNSPAFLILSCGFLTFCIACYNQSCKYNGIIKTRKSDQRDEQTAFATQDNYLFDESVRENIRMGRRNATDAEVEATAHAAGCDSFIRDLEHGYDMVVGGGGAHLSSGERQRIANIRLTGCMRELKVII